MIKRKDEGQLRNETLTFRLSKAEKQQFSEEAKKRHMEKNELLRHLFSLYFVEKFKQ